MTETGFAIRNWHLRVHQHDRRPAWIKLHTRLLDDDAYMALSPYLRATLHGLELLRARLELDGLAPLLPWSTRYLTAELGFRVSKRAPNELAEAGFITFPGEIPGSGLYAPVHIPPCKWRCAAE